MPRLLDSSSARRRTTAIAALCLGLAACSGDPLEVVPKSFSRPSAIALVCFDEIRGEGASLSSCDGSDSTFALHALVTQTSRGEVAAVNLRSNRLIDSDARVPGFTFPAVGELPSDIVVPENAPSHAYVADFGSRDVVILPLAAFRPQATATGTSMRVPLPQGPSDLILTPDESAIFVAMPGAGAIGRMAIMDDGMLGELELIPLATEVPPPVAAPTDLPSYCRACPSCDQLLRPPAEVPPRTPTYLGMEPYPVAMVIDEDNGRLLVADQHLPIIHVIDLADPSLPLPPIVAGVPTTGLALTPEVPSRLEGSERSRYLYAIDATDQSLMAIDYASGSVIPVDIGRRQNPPDRINLQAPARVIEVLSPSYPEGPPCTLADAELADDAHPLQLRGVFLAVGLANGNVQIVDVFDLDGLCRGGDAVCEHPPNDEDQEVYIQRHRPRIGSFIRSGIASIGSPSFVVDGLTYRLQSDGTTIGDGIPDLLAIEEGCPVGMTAAFPTADNTEPLLCALADPWSARSESFIAAYEGQLPRATGGLGRLDPVGGVPMFAGEIAFCSRGVLGRENAPIEGTLAGYAGDLLAITSEPPPSTADSAACAFYDPDATIEFPILRAFDDHLELGDATRGEPSLTFTEITACFTELLTYQVRAQGTYVVAGSQSGMLHRVVAAADGACTIDSSQDERRRGRVAPGEVFDNGLVRFTIEDRRPATDTRTELRFSIGQIPEQMSMDVGILPSALLFSPTDDELFAVDMASRGLVRIALQPWAFVRSFE